MLDVYLTNLGKYAEGELTGLWVQLPATERRLKEAFAEAEIDGVQYEEYFITDYDSEIGGVADCLGEYENIRELNFLAEKLSELDESELTVFEAALEVESFKGAKDLINLTYNLDNYLFMPGVSDHTDLGYYLADELNMIEIPEYLTNYFDYEAYGRDMDINSNGGFTGHGYIEDCGDFTEHYGGIDDLPDFGGPEPSPKESRNPFTSESADQTPESAPEPEPVASPNMDTGPTMSAGPKMKM